MKKKRKLDLVLLSIKVLPEDLDRLRRRANKFTEGNLSALLRHAGLVYTPKKGERITLKAG